MFLVLFVLLSALNLIGLLSRPTEAGNLHCKSKPTNPNQPVINAFYALVSV